jgi:protein-S-isoprenylcysteine O-methyltransferase Ste14
VSLPAPSSACDHHRGEAVLGHDLLRQVDDLIRALRVECCGVLGSKVLYILSNAGGAMDLLSQLVTSVFPDAPAASDLVLCAVHAILWITFTVAWLTLGRRSVGVRHGTTASDGAYGYTAAFSRTVLAFHIAAFVFMYVAIAVTVHRGGGRGMPAYRAAGGLLIVIGGAVIAWAVASLRSWRFRAQLDDGHELATGGAFALFRHPIYAGINSIALGTVLWLPTGLIALAFLLILAGSDLRARSEESILRRAFGTAYDDYARRTTRFLPGIY